MPSLVAFGRRWNIASDDFVFPEISEAFFRLLWITITLVLFVFHKPFDCKSLEWLMYIGFLIVWNVITVVLCLAMAFVSSRGSILDTHARSSVVRLIYLRVPLFVGEVIYTVFSVIFAFSPMKTDETCFSRSALQLTVGLELFLLVCVFIGILVVFNPLGDHNIDRSLIVERRYWSSRLRICKIWQTNEMRDAIDEIASLLAAFFADNDFVLSDIVAGLLLLVHSPEQRPDSYEIPRPWNSREGPEWMIMPEGFEKMSRMMDFVVAVYGWPSFLLNNLNCSSWCNLYRKLQCCRKCDLSAVTVVEDNCCFCNSAAFKLESMLEDTDIYFVSFRNRLYQVPFVVITDHKMKSIVITIRGSASVMDLVTDLSLSEDVFSVDVDCDDILKEDSDLDSSGEVRVHRGMLNSARYVYNTIRSHKVIEDLTALHPTYDLVVCGHSLGAGVASLLTLLLKQSYPEVKCYAFSPPGCVISEHGQPEMEQHVLSVIVGDDLVPRISYQSLMLLKRSIDEQLYYTNKAKYEILIKGIYKLFFSASWDLHTADSPSLRSNRALFDHLPSYGSDSGTDRAPLTEPRVRLYPPGRLVHMVVQPSQVELNWINKEFLNEFQLTGAIIADHLPFKVRRVVQRARDEQLFA